MPHIEPGDAGIILKGDGTFQLWNTFKDIAPENLTPHQIEVGKILMGFAAALKLPQIMQVLHTVANDKNIFSETVDVGTKQ
jgi:hypothetical protein